jgi:hypothetical protein
MIALSTVFCIIIGNVRMFSTRRFLVGGSVKKHTTHADTQVVRSLFLNLVIVIADELDILVAIKS